MTKFDALRALLVACSLTVVGCSGNTNTGLIASAGSGGSTAAGGSGGTNSAPCSAGLSWCGSGCVDTRSSNTDCGACGVACSAGTSCVNSACTCPTGTAACAAGCVDVSSSTANCGACGAACPVGAACSAGACKCASGLTECGAACVDTSSDAANCGACGRACNGTDVCSNSACTTQCAATLTQCGQSCVDVTSNVQNCGTCAASCAPGQTCEASTCQCPAARILCGSACIDPQTDSAHCGGCAVACDGGRSCVSGTCQCSNGQTFCGGACVNTDGDSANCGACGKACATDASCVQGTCTGGGTGGTGGSTGGTGGTTGGTGGSTGGTAGTGGSSTSGCGATTLPAACNTATTGPCTINVNGLDRQYFVVLPANYDANTAYPVVFAWHYYNGTAQGLLPGTSQYQPGMYGIRTGFPNAIYVAGQGLPVTTGGTDYAWQNTNGRDVAFARAMVTWLEANYCVDTARIFAAGMSYGGLMSDTLGCQAPDVFRALGVMSGALYVFGPNTCMNHPIAAWMTHGTADTTVPIAGGQTARDQFIADNGCSTTNTQSVVLDANTTCTVYSQCTSGNYPVVWCPVNNEGHTIPSWAASEIAKFFKQF